MSITIPRDQLHAALSRAAGFQTAKFRIHAFGHVWLNANALGLSIEATDGSMDVSCRLAAPLQAFSPFACGVPGGQFLKLVDRLSAAEVTLDLDGKAGKLLVRAGRSRASLPTMAITQFPGVEPPPLGFVPIPGKLLAEAVAGVAFTAGDGREDHANLNQLRFCPGSDGLVLQALDGHGYARRLLPNALAGWDEACSGAFGVDAKTFASRAKWIEESTEMAATAKRLFLGDDLGWWSLPALRGEYPDTGRFIAALDVPGVVEIDLDAAELAAVADRLGIFLDNDSPAVGLELRGDGLFVYSNTGAGSSVGEGVEQIETAEARGPIPGGRLLFFMPGKAFGGFCCRATRSKVRIVVTPNFGPVGVKPLCENGRTLPDWLGVMTPFDIKTVPYWTEGVAA
jgi:hypothetical protein